MTQLRIRRFSIAPLRSNGLLDLYEMMDVINFSPPYQRLAIWDKAKKQLFIDSIINGMDIPKLYFHDVRNRDDRYLYSVIDGKQRLIAIREFIDNVYPLAQDFVCFDNPALVANGKFFKDLLLDFPSLYGRIISSDLPVCVISADDDRFIEELFSRLNVQIPLSAPERRNSLGGPLPYLIREIGSHRFFTECISIPNSRYQHLDLAVKFLYLSAVQEFQSTKRHTLDKFVIDNREAFPSYVGELRMKCINILDKMKTFFGETEKNLLSSQGRITLYFHIFRLYDSRNQMPSVMPDQLHAFKNEVDLARRKSQRLVDGISQETLTVEEQDLIAFDREKQSPNDGGALRRQYASARRYFQREFALALPDPE